MRAWAEVDLSVVRGNVDVVRRQIGGKGVWAVVKADAYGHGIEPVAKALDQAGVDGFAVIGLDEAQRVRSQSPQPVLVMGYLSDSEVEDAVRQGFHLSLFDPSLMNLFRTAAIRVGRPAIVHVKVETGLNRLGMQPREAIALIDELATDPHFSVFGLMTHLSNSADRDEDLRQLASFQSVVDAYAKSGLAPQVHMTKSHALGHFPEGVFDFARVGLAVFGFEEVIPGLRPAMSVKSVVMQRKSIAAGEGVSYGKIFIAEKPMDIAVVAMGYNEGLSLSMSGKIDLLVNGRRARQIGKVCMNLTVIDVTGIDANRGDEVVALGTQGSETIDACEIADRTGLRQHEIVTRLGRSLPKRYV